MAKLYTKEGWIDFEKCEKLSSTLNIILAPRNAGKTYGKMLYNHKKQIPYIFMRTTQKQIDTVFTDELSPFEALNRHEGSRYICQRIPKTSVTAVYSDYDTDDNGKRKPKGAPVNYCISLLQIGTIRGFNLDHVPELIYDEFVKHPGEIIQNYSKSAEMYFDIMVTLNRAREMQGKKPLKQWLFGNSDNLGVPILQNLRLIKPILSMMQSGENYRKLQDRDISIFLCSDSPAAKLLQEISSISKILDGTAYSEMAFENEFINDDFSMCAPQPIGQYVPVALIGNVMLMEHKNRDLYYIRAYSGNMDGAERYTTSSAGIAKFKEDFGYLYYWYLNDSIYFSSYNEKLYFKRLLAID